MDSKELQYHEEKRLTSEATAEATAKRSASGVWKCILCKTNYAIACVVSVQEWQGRPKGGGVAG